MVQDRLKQARIEAGFSSAAAAAKSFGWPIGTYGGHENGHRGIRTPTLTRYARAFGVDLAWLVAGDVASATRPVPVIELAAAAGGGARSDDETRVGHVWFRRDWLARHDIDPVRAVVIGVHGESMEPTLTAGASILVDRGRRQRHDGRIYVVRLAEGLVVKRAERDNERWLLVSDHPAFAPAVWPDDAHTLGEVRWVARSLP